MASGQPPSTKTNQTPPRDPATSRRTDMRHACETICRLSTKAQPDLTRVASIVEGVPLLRDRVMRQVNSLRNRLHNPISSLEHAVVYLGAARVRQVAEDELQQLNKTRTITHRLDEQAGPGVPGRPHMKIGRPPHDGAV